MFKGFRQFVAWEQSTLDTIDFKTVYVDISQDLVSGLLLSQIVYWYLPNKEGKSKLRVNRDGHYWIAKTRTDWYNEIRISPKQYDNAVKKLEKLKIVEKKVFKFDSSPTTHIRLNIPVFLELLGAELSRAENALSDDFTDYLYDQSENKNTAEALGDMEFTQRGKTNLPKGENGIYPKGKNLNRENLKEYPKKNNKNLSINEIAEYEFLHNRLSKMLETDRLTDYKLDIVVKVAKDFVDLFPYEESIKNEKEFIEVLDRCLKAKTKTSFQRYLERALSNEIKNIEQRQAQTEESRSEANKPVRTEDLPEWFDEEEEKTKKVENEERDEGQKETFDNLMKERERSRKALLA